MSLLVIIIILIFGFLFLAVELFFTPGLTIFGILGALTIIVAVFLSFQYFPVEYFVLILGLSLFISGLFLFVFFKSGIKGRLSLSGRESSSEGFKPFKDNYQIFLNKSGQTKTTLRPSGTIVVEGKHLSAISEGDFIEQGEPIEVIRVEGNKLVVRKQKI
jgi:membrane-bound serine protease (ClpP class)